MNLPVIGPLDKAHYLCIDKKRVYIDTKTPFLEKLMSNLPSVKEDKILNKSLAKVNERDKGQIFDRSKVQMELICDDCNANRCVYSNKIVGAKGGLTKSEVEELQ